MEMTKGRRVILTHGKCYCGGDFLRHVAGYSFLFCDYLLCDLPVKSRGCKLFILAMVTKASRGFDSFR